MDPDEILLETEASMEKAFDYMTHEFAAVRTGKASPALVENLDVEAYGTSMKLKQLALITTPEPRLLVIQPFDAGTVRDIEKAIKESKLGINPMTDGKLFGFPCHRSPRKGVATSSKASSRWARKPASASARRGATAWTN